MFSNFFKRKGWIIFFCTNPKITMNPFRTPSLKKRRAPGAQQMREALDCTEIRGRRSSPFPKETAFAPQTFFKGKRRARLPGGRAAADRSQGSRSKAPVAGGRAGTPAVSAARRVVGRPRLSLKGRSPKPEPQPPHRGQSRQPQRQDARPPLRSRRLNDGQKKTGRSGKRSIPRMEKQWREARRFGVA